ncbi:MAG TPA: LLM class flavin-dependent oxidoreductase [Asanoa sp.]
MQDVLASADSVSDPWISLAGVALSTSRMRIGIMLTPLAGRLPWEAARQAATIDHLSGGRLVFGAGLGYSEADFTPFGGQWDALHHRARRVRSAPVFSPGVRWAVYEALPGARRRGVRHARPEHLVVGSLALPRRAASAPLGWPTIRLRRGCPDPWTHRPGRAARGQPVRATARPPVCRHRPPAGRAACQGLGVDPDTVRSQAQAAIGAR